MAAIRRVVDGSHPPWSLRPHCCKRDLGRGLSSAGYKLMRRVPHSAKGLRLGSNAHGKLASTGEHRVAHHGSERWSRIFAQCVKWNFCLTAGKDSARESGETHEEESTPEP